MWFFPVRRPLRGAALVSLAIAVMGGCASPEFRADVRAGATPPLDWHGRLPETGRDTPLESWWESFGDPQLTELLASARQSSPTVAAALARTRQARAQAGAVDAGSWPELSLQAKPFSRDNLGDKHSIGATVNGGIDLFGYQTRSQEAALARVRSAVHAWQGAQATLAADVATAYFARRQCLSDIEVLRQDLASRETIRALTELKVDAGVLAPAEASRAAAAVPVAAGQVAAREAACAQSLNQLALLTGIPPDQVAARVKSWGPAPSLYAARVTVVPAGLVARRPDIQVARESAVAAWAEVGMAEVSRLPQLSVGGAITALAGGAPSTWNLAASLVAPLFDGGRRAAAVTAAEARYAESVASYRGAVVLAVREVEDALARVSAASRQAESAAAVAGHYLENLQVAEARYAHGAASLIELEEARQLHLSAVLTLNSLINETRQAHVALFRALGGGWPQSES